MTIHFYKYQGTGNDFVMIDDRKENFTGLTTAQINLLCNRRFGIGADGLILLRNSKEFDFEMIYYNSDGRQSSMCGNGGRCILQFVHDLGIVKDKYAFKAIDGLHYGIVKPEEVSLQMNDVAEVKVDEKGELFLDTGSPHHIVFGDSLPGNDFVDLAKAIRHSQKYDQQGVNVNFAKANGNHIEMRTFERGVEDETLSCGTGVTAAALAANFTGRTSSSEISVKTAGGDLKVSFKREGDKYWDIWLTGPARQVFRGEIEL